MNHAIAEQIAQLLNEQNQLTEPYDAERVLEEAAGAVYIWRLDGAGKLLGVVCVKRVQWYQCEIKHLSVRVKRQGTGRWLLERALAEAEARGAALVQCTIRVGNSDSEAFFTANGFKATTSFQNPESGNRVTVFQRLVQPATVEKPVFPQTVVPIFLPNSAGAFDFHGTGTFVFFEGRFFLVTAAHVFDGTKHSRELMVATSPEAHALEPLSPRAAVSPMPANGNRKHDPLDVAVIPISPLLAAGLCSTGAVFALLDRAKFDWFEVLTTDDIIFAGFPFGSQRMFPLPEGMHIQPPLTKALYLHQVQPDEAAAVGYDTNRHLVGRFLHPATRPPDFDASNLKYESHHGMSGGSIWHRNRDRVAFVGIVTAWWPPDDRGYMLGTRLSEVRQLFEDALRLPCPP
jgi:GNAT superfamily N-acetyltransferase